MSTPGMSQPQEQGSPGQGQPPSGQQQDPLQDFRQLAQQVQQLAQKYPEAAEGSATILKTIKDMMTRVAGNPQRTQEKQAPPAS